MNDLGSAAAPSQILQSVSDAVAEIVEKVSPSVVSVESGKRVGSGTIWSSDGYIVTVNHVVGNRDTVNVGVDGSTFEAKVVGHDPYSDLSLLKIEGISSRPVEHGNLDELKVGQFVLALANPFNLQPSATSGIITSLGRSIRGWWGAILENVIITDARLNPGYSGGPLVDVAGRIVGLNTAYISSRGIAIPISKVGSIVDALIHEGKIKRAYLGIVSNVVSLPEEIASQSQVNQDSGIIVLSVEASSAAKQAGVAMGDVIVKFDGKPVTSVYDLQQMLTGETIGREAKLSLFRGEKLIELTVTPGEVSD